MGINIDPKKGSWYGDIDRAIDKAKEIGFNNLSNHEKELISDNSKVDTGERGQNATAAMKIIK